MRSPSPPHGSQLNLVAISTTPVERLIAIRRGDQDPKSASGRWVQENAFKHGNERSGTNQLDDRFVELYPQSTIISNPARRKLEHSYSFGVLAAATLNSVARCAIAP